jgi:phosphate transport system substrate-binding protein
MVAIVLASGGAWNGLAWAEHPGINHSRPEVDPAVAVYQRQGEIEGVLTIAGSDTMQPLLVRLVKAFNYWHPAVRIAVEGERRQPATTQSAVQPLLDGIARQRRGDGAQSSGHQGSLQVRLLSISRPLSQDEIAQFVERFGYKPIALPIAMDAVAVYVHRDNPIKGMTLEQVDAVFSSSRKRGAAWDARTWGDLGMSFEWENRPIVPYGRNELSTGTRAFFREHVLLGGDFKRTVREQLGPALVAIAIGEDPQGIGYGGIGFATSAIRAVPLAEKTGMPFVEPTRDEVTTGNYPLGRQLYLYLNHQPNQKLLPAIAEFLKFVNSQEGQRIVVNAGLYPLSPIQVTRNLKVISSVSASGAPVPSSGAGPSSNGTAGRH